jgi:hypothetical protein
VLQAMGMGLGLVIENVLRHSGKDSAVRTSSLASAARAGAD